MWVHPVLTTRLLIALVACLIAGCSALRIGYNNGETVSYWWLNSYVDFEQEQETGVRKHIAAFFGWHRKTQLKEYAQLFRNSQKRLQQTVAPADMRTDYDAAKKQLMLSVDHALPKLAQLALSLQPHQIARIEKKFAANNEAYRKDYLRGDVESRQLFRFKKVMKQAEYWFGDFNAEQEAQIKAASDSRPLNNELWLKVRQRRQQEMIKVLRRIAAEKPGADDAAKLLKEYVSAHFDQTPNAEEAALIEASSEGVASMMAVIVNIATPAQKEHAAKRMQQWIDDCNRIGAAAQ